MSNNLILANQHYNNSKKYITSKFNKQKCINGIKIIAQQQNIFLENRSSIHQQLFRNQTLKKQKLRQKLIKQQKQIITKNSFNLKIIKKMELLVFTKLNQTILNYLRIFLLKKQNKGKNRQIPRIQKNQKWQTRFQKMHQRKGIIRSFNIVVEQIIKYSFNNINQITKVVNRNDIKVLVTFFNDSDFNIQYIYYMNFIGDIENPISELVLPQATIKQKAIKYQDTIKRKGNFVESQLKSKQIQIQQNFGNQKQNLVNQFETKIIQIRNNNFGGSNQIQYQFKKDVDQIISNSSHQGPFGMEESNDAQYDIEKVIYKNAEDMQGNMILQSQDISQQIKEKVGTKMNEIQMKGKQLIKQKIDFSNNRLEQMHNKGINEIKGIYKKEQVINSIQIQQDPKTNIKFPTAFFNNPDNNQNVITQNNTQYISSAQNYPPAQIIYLPPTIQVIQQPQTIVYPTQIISSGQNYLNNPIIYDPPLVSANQKPQTIGYPTQIISSGQNYPNNPIIYDPPLVQVIQSPVIEIPPTPIVQIVRPPQQEIQINTFQDTQRFIYNKEVTKNLRVEKTNTCCENTCQDCSCCGFWYCCRFRCCCPF